MIRVVRIALMSGLMLVVSNVGLFGQTSSGIARHFTFGTVLPSTCSPGTADIFGLTSGGPPATTAAYYTCTGVNTWSLLGTATGTQTPWASDINAASHGLSNVTAIGVAGAYKALAALYVNLNNGNGNGLLYSKGSDSAYNMALAVQAPADGHLHMVIDNEGNFYTSHNWLLSGFFDGTVASDGTITITDFGYHFPTAANSLIAAGIVSDQQIALGIKASPQGATPTWLIHGFDQNSNYIWNVDGLAGWMSWGVGATAGSMDLGAGRCAAGVFCVGSTTAGDFSGTVKTTVVNAVTGFEINGAAPSGHFPRGDGAHYVDGTVGLGDLPSQANATFLGNTTGGSAVPAANAIPASAHGLHTSANGVLGAQTGHDIAVPLTCADSSGSGAVQSCTTAPSFTPVANDCVIYTTTTANTGAGLTLNVNSLGAKSVAKWQGTTTLSANDVLANKAVMACYDGTNWEISTIGNAPAAGGNTTSTSLTSGKLSKANGANSIIDSSVSDDGTTVSTTEPISAPSVSTGTSPPSITAGTGGVAGFGEGTVPSVGAAVGVDLCYADSTLHGWKCSYNNGSYSALPLLTGTVTAKGLVYSDASTGNLIDISADFTVTSHTLASGASGILDLSAASATAGFKPPATAGAAPTTDGVLSFDTTAHRPVYGANGATFLVNPMTTAGDTQYGGTNGLPTRLAKGNSGQVYTQGATNPGWSDFPLGPFEIPAANCVSTVAGSAWDTALTPTCTAGTNNKGGTLPFVDASTAQFRFQLPGNWDTTIQPYIKIEFDSGSNTTGTVIFNAAVACSKEDGSVTSDPAFNTADALATKTMAAASRMWGTSVQLTQVTSGNNCVGGGTMRVQITRATDTAGSAVNVHMAVITVMGTNVQQAN